MRTPMPCLITKIKMLARTMPLLRVMLLLLRVTLPQRATHPLLTSAATVLEVAATVVAMMEATVVAAVDTTVVVVMAAASDSFYMVFP